jgi:hypothetical protein
MPLAFQKSHADYNPPVNSYVPVMSYAADIMEGAVYIAKFGAPLTASNTNLCNTATILTSTTTFVRSQFASSTAYLATARFGSSLQFVSAASTASSVVTIYGRDYLGQPIIESLTITSNVAVTTIKCYKTIDKLVFASNAGTITAGWGRELGLPYKTTYVIREVADGVDAAAGTLTAPVLTDPATASTGEPRGRYKSTTTPDGSKQLSVVAIADNSHNGTNGGLHGIAHYGG